MGKRCEQCLVQTFIAQIGAGYKRDLALPVEQWHELARGLLPSGISREGELDGERQNTSADHQFCATHRTDNIDIHISPPLRQLGRLFGLGFFLSL
jgi:hypothetical protein